jgi:hypothetical protein
MAKDHAGHNSASQELETDPALVPPESPAVFRLHKNNVKSVPPD